jgi:hypothetical protein
VTAGQTFRNMSCTSSSSLTSSIMLVWVASSGFKTLEAVDRSGACMCRSRSLTVANWIHEDKLRHRFYLVSSRFQAWQTRTGTIWNSHMVRFASLPRSSLGAARQCSLPPRRVGHAYTRQQPAPRHTHIRYPGGAGKLPSYIFCPTRYLLRLVDWVSLDGSGHPSAHISESHRPLNCR